MIRPSNKKLKEALMYARTNVRANKYGGFICNCLPINDAGYYLRYFIAKAINGEPTLNAWVRKNVTRPNKNFPSGEDMKAYRLRWIDYMLEGL